MFNAICFCSIPFNIVRICLLAEFLKIPSIRPFFLNNAAIDNGWLGGPTLYIGTNIYFFNFSLTQIEMYVKLDK